MSDTVKKLTIQIPEKLGFLLKKGRFKIAWGGRASSKSWSFADAILVLGAAQPLRILCCREIQKSIDESVHSLLKDRIASLGLSNFYKASKTEITGRNGTRIVYAGLSGQTVTSIKSYEGIDICWVEEGQNVKKRSMDILIPTIRKPGSEIWVSWNPDMDTDDAWQRWMEFPPPDAIVINMNYRDNRWLSKESEADRLHCFNTDKDNYENIWEGKCKTVIAGAIYTREIITMIEQGRWRPTPYDPRFPVHTVWDLGWNDAMTIILFQKVAPSVINIIGYIEDNGRTYAEYIAELRLKRYVWGTDWLPHDSVNHNPISGTSAVKTLRALNRTVRVIKKTNEEIGIKAGRMLFPRIYMDTSNPKLKLDQGETGYKGAFRLMECLKHYRRTVPLTTGEPAKPAHDEYSHGAAAFRYLAEIADKVENNPEGDEDFSFDGNIKRYVGADGRIAPHDRKYGEVKPFRPSDKTMGNLG